MRDLVTINAMNQQVFENWEQKQEEDSELRSDTGYLFFPTADVDILWGIICDTLEAEVVDNPSGATTNLAGGSVCLPIPFSQVVVDIIEKEEDRLLRKGSAVTCGMGCKNTACAGVMKKGDLLKLFLGAVLRTGLLELAQRRLQGRTGTPVMQEMTAEEFMSYVQTLDEDF
jgi:hypothetical protein